MSAGLDNAALAAAGLATIGTLAYGMFAPRSTFFGPVISSGRGRRTRRGHDGDTRAVALTFDDGPWPGSTDLILDILKQESAPAAFFVIGRYADEHPALLRRIHDEGHLIANHSYDHARSGMFKWARYWRGQIARTDDAVHRAAGVRPALFRPPMGFKSPHLMTAARTAEHQIITWSRRAYDGVATTPEAIVRHVARSRPGDIILLHDGRDPASQRSVDATARALPSVIAALRAANLTPVRLDQLLGLSGYREAAESRGN